MSRERAAKAMLRGTCWLQRCVSALNTCETMWRDQNTVVLYSGALCALSEVEHLLEDQGARARCWCLEYGCSVYCEDYFHHIVELRTATVGRHALAALKPSVRRFRQTREEIG